jgi:gamma-glutamyltranspeptidase / glutathione hydrolase
VGTFYRGPLADQIVRNVRTPPTTAGAELPVPPGFMRPGDLLRYRTRMLAATHLRYRGLDVFGMPPSSSGGTTVGEALNILERVGVPAADHVQALHNYLEASALAFADRAAYLGDPAYVDVPVRQLLSQGYGSERACEVDPDQAADKPVPAGEPDGDYTRCEATPADTGSAPDLEGRSTTHLSVVDRHGSMVAYTLTIEQTGGSAITVPHRGFLLNNELTDFSVEYVRGDPNRIQGGKRPRSSMSPTIVLRDGRPWLAIGSPGGSTIITTVLQTLVNRVDLGMSLPAAIAAPRASQRNEPDVTAEQSFIDAYGDQLEAYGHTFVPAGDPGTSAAEIGAVAAVELKPGGRLLAAAEPERRGGGAAGVVRPLLR